MVCVVVVYALLTWCCWCLKGVVIHVDLLLCCYARCGRVCDSFFWYGSVGLLFDWCISW